MFRFFSLRSSAPPQLSLSLREQKLIAAAQIFVDGACRSRNGSDLSGNPITQQFILLRHKIW
ncbi:MAG: hypothetical protein L0Y72_05795 [Gemmataceae bacterium]|nr:hypothetical protein [Gemmataceae bacterium]MCI0738537.1 hypothetical protein [Gemmataceae bacterium]